MNFRDKLAKKLHEIDHPGIWWESSQFQEHYRLIADSLIPIIKELIETMELPDVEGKYGSLTATSCKNAQVDLLKAIEILLEAKNG